MKLTIYQIDAFTSKLFCGNPAAVIPLEEWLDGSLMQQIALENNLSETVFFVRSKTAGVDFDIRWFTPELEINLCGHATLASAFTLFNILNYPKNAIRFSSKSGLLDVALADERIVMDFPGWKPERLETYPEQLNQILGNIHILGVYRHRDLLVELEDEEAVRICRPDFTLMKKYVDKMIVTAPAGKSANEGVDFVSRFFAPGVGIDEDPVTGSAHSQLIPFWSEKLGKRSMKALQLSRRGGEIWCEQISPERVTMSGNCVFYMKGEINI